MGASNYERLPAKMFMQTQRPAGNSPGSAHQLGGPCGCNSGSSGWSGMSYMTGQAILTELRMIRKLLEAKQET